MREDSVNKEDSSPMTEATNRRDDAVSRTAVDELAREYEADGLPFTRVTVVRREAPVSADVGDSPIATTLSGLPGALSYDVTRLAAAADDGGAVASDARRADVDAADEVLVGE
jgi:hypothetical protein